MPLASYKYSEAWASLRGIDRGHSARGVIAQELEASGMNGLVKTKPVDEADPDGPDRKSVNYSVLYMKAVKALQEAMVRIETLEAKVDALKIAEAG